MWRALLPCVLLVAACGSESVPGATTATPTLPASYSFDLASSCGERNGLGRFHVTVADGEVSDVRPLGGSRLSGLGPEDFPTIDDLEAMAADAEPGAEVEVSRSADGLLTALSIDHVPEAIDDEECYEVTGLQVQAATDGPRVSCGGEPPGWPVAAMDGGIEPETPTEEIAAALRDTAEEMGMDGPWAMQGPDVEDAPWFVLAETDESVTVATGTWSPAGPGEDAMVVGYDRTDDGLVWGGHGQCLRLAVVHPQDSPWVQVTAPRGGLVRDTTTVPVLVTEQECTSGRDPRPFLHEPVVAESAERVVVTWTTTPVTGGADCQGNPSVEQSIELDEPLGDRPLLDGSTWPPTRIGTREDVP